MPHRLDSISSVTDCDGCGVTFPSAWASVDETCHPKETLCPKCAKERNLQVKQHE